MFKQPWLVTGLWPANGSAFNWHCKNTTVSRDKPSSHTTTASYVQTTTVQAMKPDFVYWNSKSETENLCWEGKLQHYQCINEKWSESWDWIAIFTSKFILTVPSTFSTTAHSVAANPHTHHGPLKKNIHSQFSRRWFSFLPSLLNTNTIRSFALWE